MIRDHVDEIVLVSDAEIVATMKLMWERMKLVSHLSTNLIVFRTLSSGCSNQLILIACGRLWNRAALWPRLLFSPTNSPF